MTRDEFLQRQRHYNFGDNTPKEPTVERKDSEEGGRHKVELTLALETEAARHAVIIFIQKLDEMHYAHCGTQLLSMTNWLEGYIAAMYAAEAIDQEQALQLDSILKLTIDQQAKALGIENFRDKEQ